MLESDFQSHLKKRLISEYPGSVVLKNDPNYIQGIPDLVVFYNNKYAMLEVKKSASASHRPNQNYYVEKFNAMSFAAFIYPENEEDILNELAESFKS